MSIVGPLGRRALAAVILFSSSHVLETAYAAQPVGDAKRIVNLVTGAGSRGRRDLKVEDPVYRNEKISAGADSHGELQLHDGSHVLVGENSTVALDNFVISGSDFSSGTIRLTKGAFRFISGGSGKEAIKIKTPLATIGVRGTVVDVYVQPKTGVTNAVLISGKITACSPGGGGCKTVNRACDILQIDKHGNVSQLPFLRSRKRTRQEESKMFNLTENQQNFSPQWRAIDVACSGRAAAEIADGLPPSNGVEPYSAPPAPPTPEPPHCGGEG